MTCYLACTVTFQVSFSFGGSLWPISSDDMVLQTDSPGICVGAIFDFSLVTGMIGGPQWVIGDTFLVCTSTIHNFECSSLVSLMSSPHSTFFFACRKTFTPFSAPLRHLWDSHSCLGWRTVQLPYPLPVDPDRHRAPVLKARLPLASTGTIPD